MGQYHNIIAEELQIRVAQVAATASLLADGGTVPFIARYRKEATGLLDENQITAVRDRLSQLAELDKRRQAMVESLSERDLLSKELHQAIIGAGNLTVLEDIYLPHRPKRRTRGMIAREKGLEPLARLIFAQGNSPVRVETFVNPRKEVHSADEALAGARDIMAEWLSEDSFARAGLRKLFTDNAIIGSTVIKSKRESGLKFRDYFDWREPAAKVPSHRLLAMFRGEKEKFLSLTIRPPEEDALKKMRHQFVKNGNWSGLQVTLAIADCFKRLLGPSLENELRSKLKERADLQAIQVFADNLRELLLAPPLGQKRVMALDPGFRSGAKLVCLNGQGRLLHCSTIYPTQSEKQKTEASQVVIGLCRKHQIEAIAIGNGTAGRETEAFIRGLDLSPKPVIAMVDESGASIYSASETAQAEFPDHDLTVRGSISIGRRLQDPLAELIKLDPKAIGVGQYQHDVNQAALRKSLEDVVESCVNKVGVEVNTASVELLTLVSGLGKTLAANIITWRHEHGPFLRRRQLLDVPRLGAKAYEQCAGFIRISGGENPLDGSGVHPEQYKIVEQMARDAGCRVEELMAEAARRQGIKVGDYVSETVGLPTLNDIMAELAKPGRDPRANFSEFAFAEGINSMEDLEPGMRLPGIITNVTKFGAFVDIGVHQDGLIHISQLADRFVKDPADVVRVRQQVMVRLLEIDLPRKRIALSLRGV
ncbi:MAG: Tex family protein [Thermodesulfobacteriota bacterium]